MTDIIPFGKYKGQEIEQVRMRDPQYLQWLTQQAWFQEKFAPVYQVVINNFAPPSEDTPAHNALQVLFLEDEFRDAFWVMADLVDDRALEWLRQDYKRNTAYRRDVELHPQVRQVIGKPSFEGASDVVFSIAVTLGRDEEYWAVRHYRLAIEIKPSMGDDYPAVLRQIKQQKAAARFHDQSPTHWFLLIDEFAARAVTLDQVRAIFDGDNISIVRLADLLELIRHS